MYVSISMAWVERKSLACACYMIFIKHVNKISPNKKLPQFTFFILNYEKKANMTCHKFILGINKPL